MASLKETAYLYLPDEPNEYELALNFTPDKHDVKFASDFTTSARAQPKAVLFIKVFKRLGRPERFKNIPEPYREYVFARLGVARPPSLAELQDFENSGAYRKLRKAAFDHLGLCPYDDQASTLMALEAVAAADVRFYTADIINVMLEQLVLLRYELPGFTTLESIAAKAQLDCDTRYFSSITDMLTLQDKKLIDDMLRRDPGSSESTWNRLKLEPKKPTNKEVRSYLQHVKFLQNLAEKLPTPDIPPAKMRQYRAVARASDASEMAEFKPLKRYALAVIQVRTMHAQALDDSAELLIRLMQNLENQARQKLLLHQQDQLTKIDELVEQLRDVLEAYQLPAGKGDRLDAIESTLRHPPEQLIEQCEAHLAYANKNFIPFMLPGYKAVRAQLLNCIEITAPRTSSDDDVMERMIKALKQLRNDRNQYVLLSTLGLRLDVDFGWMSKHWRKVTLVKTVGSKVLDAVNRNFFEMAVLQQIKDEFKNGDLYIKFGERYDDYREQLVSAQEYEAELPKYGEVTGIEVNAHAFVAKLKEQHLETARLVDQGFPKNSHVSLVEGKLVFRKPPRSEVSAATISLDKRIAELLEPVSIIDVLTDVTGWLGLPKHFKHLGGQETRMDDLPMRMVASLFCYGCNLGPVQTSRSVKGISRKQLAWLNLKYVTEDVLEGAITSVVNWYAKLDLPKYWGTGEHVSADGTKWDMYEQNLLSEYHLRYGSYGGIGYYHTSDTYIALFSHFMACGRYEGTYILDGLMSNQSDIRPDMVHGDTQAQNYAVFALSHLLGIKLMPRIRGIRDLTFFRPDGRVTFEHIDDIFGESIDWKLIEQHLPSMFKIGVSVMRGVISPSAILRRLGSQNRKNKMFYAIRELGKVVRTMYLLEYIHSVEMRQMVHAKTNKSEQFNGFAKWNFFGNSGVIEENLRHEQAKIIKYNHLVTNMVIYHNTVGMTKIIQRLMGEGVPITPEMLAGLSPYRWRHINQLGDYTLDFKRKLAPIALEALALPRLMASEAES